MLEAQTTEQREAPPMSEARQNLRTFRIAAWLGWQVEGNWADPLVFFIFTILRPMASALILYVMYEVIRGGQRDNFFDYLYVSNAFFMVVLQALSGMAWAVLDDRENYRMLKYIYTSPARHLSYLLGRAVAKMLIGFVTTVILLVTGVLFLGLHLDLAQIAWGWLVVYFILGLVILLSLGIIMAGVALVVARNGAAIGEVVGGSLLLFSGAYFAVDILPTPLKEISLGVPITYWLEGMRRAIEGGILTVTVQSESGQAVTQAVSPVLAQFDNWQLLGILAFSAVVCTVVAYLFYNWVENAAKERGMIDRLTGY
ncbi:MAG: ABC transporter permease [Chloroflexota bacterium]|nr:ABC transporter permease [Chloroflexota bacterium]